MVGSLQLDKRETERETQRQTETKRSRERDRDLNMDASNCIIYGHQLKVSSFHILLLFLIFEEFISQKHNCGSSPALMLLLYCLLSSNN